MKPRRLHSETSLSILDMSMALTSNAACGSTFGKSLGNAKLQAARCILFRPALFDDARRRHFDPQRVAAQLRHDRELVHFGRERYVVRAADLLQMLAPLADLQGAEQDAAMVLEAIPGEAGAVVEAHVHRVTEEFDQRAGKERVFKAWFACVTGADDMNRTRIAVQLFAYGAEIDEASDEHALRFDGAQDGAGAVAGSEDQRLAFAILGGILARRVAQLEVGNPFAAAFAAEQDAAFWQGRCQRFGFLDLHTGVHRGAACGQRVDDGRRRSQDIDHDGDAPLQPARLEQLRHEMNADILGGHEDRSHEPCVMLRRGSSSLSDVAHAATPNRY